MNPEIKQLRDKLKGLKIDGMIVSNPISVKYLTGLNAEGILLIDPKENVFITDGRYIEQVNNLLTIDSEIIAYDSKSMDKYDYEAFFSMCENVGFEEKYVTYEDYKNYLQVFKVNLVETEGIIESQRIVKEDYEIEKIKKACEIADKGFEYIIKNIKKGMTEKQIAYNLNNYMLENGAEDIAFDTIVASGPNSSMPHAVPSNRVIEENDIILFDFGAKYEGYLSDLSRTVFVGTPTKKQEEVFKFVLEQQEKVIKNFKEGTNMKTILKNREMDYKLAGYDIIHSFGHGVGLEIHEAPRLKSEVDGFLKKNSIITVEPGVYLPGEFGVRIEDTCLIEKDRCITLTKCNKDMINIKLV